MQFLALTRRRTESFSPEQFAAQLDVEAARARELYAEGVFRQLHSRGDLPGAVILIEAADRAAAEQAMATLPFAKLAMMDIELIELRPYRGFAAG
jgi:muconolactone delta-isomerase